MLKNILKSLLIMFLFFSCEKGETNQFELRGENGFSYNESFELWNKLKENNGNSYVYKTKFVSWTNYGSSTELKIKNGIVVERIFEKFRYLESNGEKEIIDSYFENIENLGTHDKGALPKTIDALYNSCASEYLMVNSKENEIYFDTNENGLLSLCGFVPIGCVDDCFRGVQLDSFYWLE